MPCIALLYNVLYAVNYIMLTRLRVSSERFLHDLTKAVTIIPIPKIANEKPNALQKRKKSFNTSSNKLINAAFVRVLELDNFLRHTYPIYVWFTLLFWNILT